MTYIPRRDYRFEYIWEAIQFIEENQCRNCIFSKLVTDPGSHADEYPMCWEIEAEIILEQPVEVLEDAGVEGVVCTKYREE